eukprot:7385261-Prymnesium_polylepis.1
MTEVGDALPCFDQVGLAEAGRCFNENLETGRSLRIDSSVAVVKSTAISLCDMYDDIAPTLSSKTALCLSQRFALANTDPTRRLYRGRWPMLWPMADVVAKG